MNWRLSLSYLNSIVLGIMAAAILFVILVAMIPLVIVGTITYIREVK